jgi:Zn/Cd-binding protein ZinT
MVVNACAERARLFWGRGRQAALLDKLDKKGYNWPSKMDKEMRERV